MIQRKITDNELKAYLTELRRKAGKAHRQTCDFLVHRETIQKAYTEYFKSIGAKRLSILKFNEVISLIHKYIADEILQGKAFIMPYRLGTLELLKRKVRVYIKDGKLVSTAPIDWPKTIKMGLEYPDTKKAHQPVRIEREYAFSIHYRKSKAKFNNQSFVGFKTSSSLREKMTEKANKGELDTILMLENLTKQHTLWDTHI